ncbi:MAG: glycosyltransferase family 4 protein [Caulobacterales bacterium]|uniref:glycosyltransferase family 4 protein n=1 Tax=Glycocaulis sp. TaxID=1969725 RepID=UPI003F9F0573
MKILQLVPELDAGGAERTTIDVAEAVVQAGGQALVASLGGRLEGELDAVGAELVRLDMKTKNPLAMHANARRLAELVKARQIDIIHARSRAPAWSGFLAARQTHIPFVTTYHGTYNAKSVPKRFYNSVMARGDAVIANSHFIAEHVRAEHGPVLAARRADLSHLHVIPRGVDFSTFDPALCDPLRVQGLRAAWLDGRDAPVILLPARLTAWKGQRLAIEAVALLSAMQGSGQPVLVCAGDAQGRDGYVEELRALAAQKGVALVLAGHVTDMGSAYLVADVVINPSTDPEAFGRTLAEAMAMERLVIAAAHGGPLEILSGSETGWLFEPGNASDLARRLHTALTLDPPARKLRGQLARQRVIGHYSREALQAATLRVYAELLD